jgi:hypothetical protein
VPSSRDEEAALLTASTFFTPPLVPDGNSQIDCYIINVGKKSGFVEIEALDKQGNIVASWSEMVAPAEEAVAIATATNGPRSCRFAVEGTGRDFRASGLVVVPGVGSIIALPAE